MFIGHLGECRLGLIPHPAADRGHHHYSWRQGLEKVAGYMCICFRLFRLGFVADKIFYCEHKLLAAVAANKE